VTVHRFFFLSTSLPPVGHALPRCFSACFHSFSALVPLCVVVHFEAGSRPVPEAYVNESLRVDTD
jgi:hypothetical protein